MCGNYFAIKLTVYIYTVPKAVIFMRKKERKKKKRGKTTLWNNSLKFQTERLILLDSFFKFALDASVVFIVKCHVSTLKVQFPDRCLICTLVLELIPKRITTKSALCEPQLFKFNKVWSSNSATTERADEGLEFLHNFPHCTELEIL